MPEININNIIVKPGTERAILSIILQNTDRIVDCEEKGLISDHFGVEGNQYLYSIISYLYTSQDVNRIDALLIYNTIREPSVKIKVDDLGGLRYIESLFRAEIQDNLDYYLKELRDLYVKRNVYTITKSIQQKILQNAFPDSEALVHELQNKTLEIAMRSTTEEATYRMGSNTEAVLLERSQHVTPIAGLAMGWSQFDNLTQGAKGNDLIVICGESKSGKSAILLEFAKKFSVDDGIPGLYIDTEMESRDQEDRLLAKISGVPYAEIVNGQFARDTIFGQGVDKLERLRRTTEILSRAPLHHIYMPNFSADDIAKTIRKYKLKHDIGYAIFDYIKLPASEVAGLGDANEYQRLGYTTSILKDMAGICNIPIITAAQGNKSLIDNDNPDANQLGGSYRILQMASKLLFLTVKSTAKQSSEGYAKGNRQLFVKYQRNGKSNNSPLDFKFDEAILRFSEVS